MKQAGAGLGKVMVLGSGGDGEREDFRTNGEAKVIALLWGRKGRVEMTPRCLT